MYGMRFHTPEALSRFGFSGVTRWLSCCCCFYLWIQPLRVVIGQNLFYYWVLIELHCWIRITVLFDGYSYSWKLRPTVLKCLPVWLCVSQCICGRSYHLEALLLHTPPRLSHNPQLGFLLLLKTCGISFNFKLKSRVLLFIIMAIA